MNKIHVDASKEYDILLDKGLINRIGELINPINKSKRVAIITDDIVNTLYGDKVSQSIEFQGFSVDRFVFPNGEKSKNIDTLSDILEFLAKIGFRRNDMLIALGGGVVGDITGLAAAIYMRGISFVQIPTTLLSVVDSSIGGKTAINLRYGKNLTGAFWQPLMVICDIDIIRNLPDGLFAEGMAEVIKCDVIRGMNIIEHVENHSVLDNLDKIIENCIILKRDIVQQDEFETMGIRNILNVGHTIAHGIEKLSNYSISHGKAVGTGLVWESMLASELGLCDDKYVQKIRRAVHTYSLYMSVTYNLDTLIDAMVTDKKNTDSRVTFMLPTTDKVCVERKLCINELKELLKDVRRVYL